MRRIIVLVLCAIIHCPAFAQYSETAQADAIRHQPNVQACGFGLSSCDPSLLTSGENASATAIQHQQTQGQEIAYLDLSNVNARTELRHPPVPKTECALHHMCGFFSGSAAPEAIFDEHKRALRTTLTWMDKAEYKDGDRAQFEATVENVGEVPIDIPWTPHLADLQPADDIAEFQAYSFGISIELRALNHDSTQIGHVILFGSPDQEETMLTLNPGQRVRIKALTTISGLAFSEEERQKLLYSPSYQTAVANCWLRRDKYSPKVGGLVVRSENIFPLRVIGGGVSVLVIPPETINRNGVREGAWCHLAPKPEDPASDLQFR